MVVNHGASSDFIRLSCFMDNQNLHSLRDGKRKLCPPTSFVAFLIRRGGQMKRGRGRRSSGIVGGLFIGMWDGSLGRPI